MKETTRLLESLNKLYSPTKIISLNSRSKLRLVNKVNEFLPEKFHSQSLVYKLIFELILNEKVSGSNEYVDFSSKYLKSSYKSIYRPKLNTIDQSSGISIFRMLLDEEVIITDNQYIVGKKNKFYKINKNMFPSSIISEITLLFLINLKTMITNSFKEPNNNYESITDLLDFNKKIENRIPDVFSIKDPDSVELSGLTESVLNKGLLGPNYLSKFLFVDIISNYINKLTHSVNNTFTDLQRPSTIGYVPYEGSLKVIGRINDNFMTQCTKLISIFTNTSSTTNEFNLLFHKSPQLVSYTGRIFETDNLGTSGLSRGLKSYNYKSISIITGIEVNNYDIRACQVAAILEYGDLYGYKFPYLEEYVENKSMRFNIANNLDIPVKLVKTLILIKMFGGKNSYNKHFPTSYQEEMNSYGISDCGIENLIVRFNTECLNILNDINYWFETVVPIVIKQCEINGKLYNGCTIVEKSYLCDRKKQSAFLLQGMESKYILSLIDLSTHKNHNYYFLSYEYDGLITLGKIPESTLIDAAKRSGFNRAILEIKDIIG